MNPTYHNNRIRLMRVSVLLVALSHFASALLPSNPSSIRSSSASIHSLLKFSIANTRRQSFHGHPRRCRGALFVAASEPTVRNDKGTSSSAPTKETKKRIQNPNAQTSNNSKSNSNYNYKSNSTNNKSNNGNNGNKKTWNRANYSNRKPWQADFKTSVRTQGRIKKAYATRFKTRSKKAKEILKALLTTHPTQVNAANVICALTYSAKALGVAKNARNTNPDQELRSMLFCTLKILNEMVVVQQPRLLNTRQLCNACWAIAKHYDRDPLLLPPKAPDAALPLSDEAAVGTVVQVKLDDATTKKKSPLEESQNLLDETLDEIALQLTNILEGEMEMQDHISGAGGSSSSGIQQNEQREQQQREQQPWKQKPAQVGEICMASWAYGKLRHRKKPPGWQDPPQTGRLSQRKNTAAAQNIITFESWNSFGRSSGSTSTSTSSSSSGNSYVDDGYEHEGETEDDAFARYSKSKHNFDVTNSLFDAIGATLCRPRTSSHSIYDDDDYWGEDEEDFQESGSRLEDCSWSELANLGWSFAAHGSCKSRQSQTLLQKLAQETSRRLHIGGELTAHLLTRDLAQLIWALGTTQADNFRLADDLVLLVEDLSNEYLDLSSPRASFTRAARPLKKWSCPDLVQVTLALAHSRIDEQPLLQAIYKENNYRLLTCVVEDASGPHDQRKCFHPWEVSVLLWAQARLYLKGEQGEMFEDFVQNASGYILGGVANGQSLQTAGIGPQEQANIVWALTVLEEHQSANAIDLARRIFQEAAESFQEHQSIQLEHAHQLWQAYFIMEEESPEAVSNVPDWFSEYLEKKWTLEKSKLKISSARHRSISQCLELMGVEHFNEHDEDIDVAIVLKKNALWTHETETEGHSAADTMSVAVEFDGPNHFAREKLDENGRMLAQPRALGHSVLKYRLLKKQGWTVVRIPYYEFDKIPFWASMERQRYLQRKLKTHGNIQFSDADVSEYKPLTPDRKTRFD